MCKIGDIIVIQKYKSQGKDIKRHSFVVIDDTDGNIQGLAFDFVSLVFSSFKSEEQKTKKLSYSANFPIVAEDVDIKEGNEGSGFIKAEQLYYFNKEKIEYRVIGSMDKDIFNLLIEFMQELSEQGISFEAITDNL